MTEAKKEQGAGTRTDFQREFDQLPLDQKFSQLFKMEVATLNEAMKFVAESSMDVISKIGSALSDLGTTVEVEAKKAAESGAGAAEKTADASAEPKTKTRGTASSAKAKPKGGPSK